MLNNNIFIGMNKYVKLLEDEIKNLQEQVKKLEIKNYKILVEKALLVDRLKKLQEPLIPFDSSSE